MKCVCIGLQTSSRAVYEGAGRLITKKKHTFKLQLKFQDNMRILKDMNFFLFEKENKICLYNKPLNCIRFLTFTAIEIVCL